MHTEPTLLKFIAEVADDPLVLDPDDRVAESQSNTWHLGADAEERAALSVEQVAAAFEGAAAALRDRIQALGFQGTATFYVWHDEQAGQLRCSTSSQHPESLPFGGTYALTETLDPVIAGFLNDDAPGLMPWTCLSNVEPGDPSLSEDEYTPPPFPVWTRSVGRDA
ncbi:hypothetical protein O3X23_35765 [Streptomyces sp. H39-S7]|nr:hypothetical protein [Streptomyces sp. H39-S7]